MGISEYKLDVNALNEYCADLPVTVIGMEDLKVNYTEPTFNGYTLQQLERMLEQGSTSETLSKEMERIERVPDTPIIVSEVSAGFVIADGCHRYAKAYFAERETMECIIIDSETLATFRRF